ncbi:LysR family transcriptional regulator [Roseibium sp. SCP14]|uniref:LysR family transcriptional regulator n=1 Tax=Roseibium sp. SCP14 TaxID=3141375 RepID=UPI00333DB071
MMPNTNDLLIFLSVAETRSITAAARQSGLTKSAVSQALKRIEDAVGAKVLFRTTRSMSLTDTGARLLPHCNSLRQVQQDLQETLAQSGRDLQRTLTVTAPHALCQSLLVPVLSSFLREGRGNVRLVAEDVPINLVEHQIDLAIRVGGSAPQSARISRIGSLHESIFGSRTLIEKRGGVPEKFEELEDWPHVANDWQGDPVTYRMDAGLQLRVSPRVRSNTVLGVRDFLEAGAGVGLLPDMLAEKSDELVRIAPVSISPIYAVHQHGTKPPRQVKEVVAALRQVLKR